MDNYLVPNDYGYSNSWSKKLNLEKWEFIWYKFYQNILNRKNCHRTNDENYAFPIVGKDVVWSAIKHWVLRLESYLAKCYETIESLVTETWESRESTARP